MVQCATLKFDVICVHMSSAYVCVCACALSHKNVHFHWHTQAHINILQMAIYQRQQLTIPLPLHSNQINSPPRARARASRWKLRRRTRNVENTFYIRTREKRMARLKSRKECCIWMLYTCHLIYTLLKCGGADGADGMLLINASQRTNKTAMRDEREGIWCKRNAIEITEMCFIGLT